MTDQPIVLEAVINGDLISTIDPVLRLTVWNGHFEYDVELKPGATVLLRVVQPSNLGGPDHG